MQDTESRWGRWHLLYPFMICLSRWQYAAQLHKLIMATGSTSNFFTLVDPKARPTTPSLARSLTHSLHFAGENVTTSQCLGSPTFDIHPAHDTHPMLYTHAKGEQAQPRAAADLHALPRRTARRSTDGQISLGWPTVLPRAVERWTGARPALNLTSPPSLMSGHLNFRNGWSVGVARNSGIQPSPSGEPYHRTVSIHTLLLCCSRVSLRPERLVGGMR